MPLVWQTGVVRPALADVEIGAGGLFRTALCCCTVQVGQTIGRRGESWQGSISGRCIGGLSGDRSHIYKHFDVIVLKDWRCRILQGGEDKCGGEMFGKSAACQRQGGSGSIPAVADITNSQAGFNTSSNLNGPSVPKLYFGQKSLERSTALQRYI